MKSFLGLTKRNILVYIKNRQAVFFSLLTPLLVFMLYLFFLKSTFVNGVENALEDVMDLVDKNDIEMFANLILLAGVIGSSVITVSYTTLTTIVSDKEERIDYDICATPIKRPVIILSYLLASFISSFVIAIVLLGVSLIVISSLGVCYLTAMDVLILFALTALGALSSTSLLMILVMLLKSSGASSAVQGILCAAVGFIISAYVPISEFSMPIQTTANIFPGSHVAAIYRDILLTGVLNHIDLSIGGVDNHLVLSSLREEFSLNLNMFNITTTQGFSWIYTASILVASLSIVSFLYTKTYKRK